MRRRPTRDVLPLSRDAERAPSMYWSPFFSLVWGGDREIYRMNTWPTQHTSPQHSEAVRTRVLCCAALSKKCSSRLS